jgi:parallel beta-helix repeat protein
LYYYKNTNDFVVPSNVGQLIIINCSNIILKNANIQECDNGILMAYCTNCKIENSTISKNDGIWTFQSNYNTFEFNNLSNNILHGITLDYASNNNIIKNNHISNNKMVGIMIEWYSKNNFITKNNLISNYYNAYQIQSFMNKWCNNYWYSRIDFLNKPLFRFIPRIIYGNPCEQIKGFMTPIAIDRHPSKEPYDIL